MANTRLMADAKHFVVYSSATFAWYITDSGFPRTDSLKWSSRNEDVAVKFWGESAGSRFIFIPFSDYRLYFMCRSFLWFALKSRHIYSSTQLYPYLLKLQTPEWTMGRKKKTPEDYAKEHCEEFEVFPWIGKIKRYYRAWNSCISFKANLSSRSDSRATWSV